MNIALGILLPFLGTTLGAGCVFFFRQQIRENLSKILLGFASGVMIAASVWSLILPSIDMSEDMGGLSCIPVLIGIFSGIGFLILIEEITKKMSYTADILEEHSEKQRKGLLMLAVTMHNIPEGMAVGVIFAGVLSGLEGVSLVSAYVLAVGIAVQNFPEGAIISLPYRAQGYSRTKAFLIGTVSGVVEPFAAGLTLLFANAVSKALPYLMSFAAGAMIYVVIEELLPEAFLNRRAQICSMSFAIGFSIMMALDVALG